MAEEVTPFVKQPIKRHHLWLMPAADAANTTDLSAYAGLTPALLLAELLTLPTQTVVNRHGIT